MSKELEALEGIIETFYDKDSEDIQIVRKALKALEIIKNKLLVGCFSKEDNYSNYAMAIMMSGNETLKKNMMTEQEYDLLREVLYGKDRVGD